MNSFLHFYSLLLVNDNFGLQNYKDFRTQPNFPAIILHFVRKSATFKVLSAIIIQKSFVKSALFSIFVA